MSVLIASIGGFLGCGLAYLVCAVLNQISFVRLTFFAGITMPPTVLAISLSVAFTMGALSFIVPAINANRVPITEVLRHLG